LWFLADDDLLVDVLNYGRVHLRWFHEILEVAKSIRKTSGKWEVLVARARIDGEISASSSAVEESQ